MAGLWEWECFRRHGPVNLTFVTPILDSLKFVSVNQTGGKYPQEVVLKAHFPAEVNALISSLNLGGQLARAVIRKLPARQNIDAHVDDWMPDQKDWRRFQIPLKSNPDVLMRWPDEPTGAVETYLEPGWLWEVRYDRTHEVINASYEDRIHLQVDQVGAKV